jgi:hypothetical protein
MQECEPLRNQFVNEIVNTRHVAARPSEAVNKSKPDRIVANIEDDRDGLGCCFGRQRRMNAPGRGYRGNLAANQFTCQCAKSIKLILGPAVFYRDVIALDMARLL